MNKHFKKHLEASYARAFAECARTGHKVGDLDAIFNSIAMATFAELIVRECSKTVNDTEYPYEDPAHKETWDACCVWSASKLKEYFGVE